MKNTPKIVGIYTFFMVFLSFNPNLFGKIRCDGDCDAVKDSETTQNISAKGSGKSQQVSAEEKQPEVTAGNLSEKKDESKQHKPKATKQTRHYGLGSESLKEKSKNSNLPDYYFDEKRSPFVASEEKKQTTWFVEREVSPPKLKSIYPGKSAFIEIDQDIVATPNVPSPIKARVKNGDLEGAIIFGEAKLEDDLNRVLISFKSLRYENETYAIQARAVDHMGAVGVTGEYIAENRGVMAGGFLSTFFSVFADSRVERHKNEQGNYVDEPNVGNAAKKGLSGTLAKSADRMMDRAQRMPGYTVVKGPTLIQVMFEEVR